MASQDIGTGRTSVRGDLFQSVFGEEGVKEEKRACPDRLCSSGMSGWASLLFSVIQHLFGTAFP